MHRIISAETLITPVKDQYATRIATRVRTYVQYAVACRRPVATRPRNQFELQIMVYSRHKLKYCSPEVGAEAGDQEVVGRC